MLKNVRNGRLVLALAVTSHLLDHHLTELKLPLLDFTHAPFLEDRPESGHTAPMFTDIRSRRYIFATEK